MRTPKQSLIYLDAETFVKITFFRGVPVKMNVRITRQERYFMMFPPKHTYSLDSIDTNDFSGAIVLNCEGHE